ncbi:IS3 family transposase [Butyricicoccus sp. Marseille-Q5471]
MNPYNHATIGSFFHTLKRELAWDAHHDNPEQVRLDIFKYIEP